MSRGSASTHFPAELVSQILDNVSFDELPHIQLVCAQWRALALAHPTYWRDIKIDNVEPAEVAFFYLRLERTNGRLFSATIEIPTAWLATAIQPLLEAVAARSHQLLQLKLVLDPRVFSIDGQNRATHPFRNAAPNLESLVIKLPSEDTTHFDLTVAGHTLSLDKTWFENSAPALRTLSVSNVEINWRTRWVYGVEKLDVHVDAYTQRLRMPAFTGENMFPSLRHLKLSGAVYPEISGGFATWGLDGLRSLDLSRVDKGLKWATETAHLDSVLEEIKYDYVLRETIQRTRSAFSGDIAATVSCAGQQFADAEMPVVISQDQPRRLRSFRDYINAWEVEQRPPSMFVFGNQSLMQHLVALEIDLGFWSRFTHICASTLPRLTKLTLGVTLLPPRRFTRTATPSSIYGDPAQMLELPSLRTITFRSLDDDQIFKLDSGWVLDFVKNTIRSEVHEDILEIRYDAIELL